MSGEPVGRVRGESIDVVTLLQELVQTVEAAQPVASAVP